ncbi:hypothetical protein BROSI_C0009 [Candidatus Brocadia sinica JPN1]|uniref:Uncharacterized protein n=1 Tax=Candidatus Brocadia sinica JPN1 TaxID=1197129 RepID=A0ABQ0K2X2_9BACT|nr:hypothetical protein BROSI_C0009 [Candidatus Brocadia sinica JPN1]
MLQMLSIGKILGILSPVKQLQKIQLEPVVSFI